jgi:branched-subunit amino acid transport protein
MNPVVIVLVAGAGSYLFRVSMLLLAAHHELPSPVARAARFAVPTAFATLAVLALVAQTDAGPVIPPVVAVVVAAVTVRVTGSAPSALLTGMPVLWALSAMTAR